MKKIYFFLVTLILSILLIGCNNSEGEEVSSNIRKIDKVESISNIDTISIESGASEIIINGYEGNELKIQGELGDYSKELNIAKRGNTLYIVEEGKVNIGINYKSTKLDIMIPKSYSGDLNFSQGAGKASINNLDLKDVNIDGGAGQLIINNINFDDLKLDSGVGQVDIETGDRSGNIDVNGGVGSINMDIKKVGGNLAYDGGLGSANIKVPRNSPINIQTESGLGSIKNSAITSGEERYIYKLSVGVGSIKIYN